jgi:cobalt-zinc-cadmium efflux system outer membrane protein
MKHLSSFLLVYCIFSSLLSAQDTLRLSRVACEEIFLRENLLMVAEKLNISQAEALLAQARLWPNPNISLEEVNLWATPGQLEYFGEELPPFAGNVGRNTQLSLSIEQLVLTAGKRKKLMAIEQVSVEMAKQYFEELLRGLKAEFRIQLTELQYLQFYQQVYVSQLASIQQLLGAYRRQVEQGNIGRGEYIRLKALELEFLKELNEISQQTLEARHGLKQLMRLPAETTLIVTEDGFIPDLALFKSTAPAQLAQMAINNRPDLKMAQLEGAYFTKVAAYEKAQRTPDLTLKGSYDRGGNFMLNFIGFGVGLDLPMFNRNQGNIRFAELGIEKSKILLNQKTLTVESEVFLAYQQLQNLIALLEGIEQDYENSLDTLLESYTRNFTQRNISLLEYLDFLDAYLDNKKIILETGRDLHQQLEELYFTIGQDLN